MPPSPTDRPEASSEEYLIAVAYQLEALIRILERKGLLTREEVLEEIQVMKMEKHAKERAN